MHQVQCPPSVRLNRPPLLPLSPPHVRMPALMKPVFSSACAGASRVLGGPCSPSRCIQRRKLDSPPPWAQYGSPPRPLSANRAKKPPLNT